ncbi:MAG: hypothetical protein Q9212_002835 [Teloschistes hypoglaucus]
MSAADSKKGRPSPAEENDNTEDQSVELEESKLPSETSRQNQHLPDDIRDDSSFDDWSKVPNWALTGCVEGWIKQLRQCYGVRRLPEFAQHRGNIQDGQTRDVIPAFKSADTLEAIDVGESHPKPKESQRLAPRPDWTISTKRKREDSSILNSPSLDSNGTQNRTSWCDFVSELISASSVELSQHQHTFVRPMKPCAAYTPRAISSTEPSDDVSNAQNPLANQIRASSSAQSAPPLLGKQAMLQGILVGDKSISLIICLVNGFYQAQTGEIRHQIQQLRPEELEELDRQQADLYTRNHLSEHPSGLSDDKSKEEVDTSPVQDASARDTQVHSPFPRGEESSGAAP